jgi:hypothetical protein
MKLSGTIRKMRGEAGRPIRYDLPLTPAGGQNGNETYFPIGDRIGKSISLLYNGKIYCIECGRITKKSFQQGFCFACFQKAPECSECVLRPELCRAHEGESRDMEWSRTHCLVEHVVYLAVSSDVKVGITRKSQVPTRWIDQGAHLAIQLAAVPNRYTAGLIEVALKAHLKDRTDWRKMLKNEHPVDVDLPELKGQMLAALPDDLRGYAVRSDQQAGFEYPVLEYPAKIKSVGFDKETQITGRLMGIKGQYLIFDGERVINMRKHQGYDITIEG